MPFDLHPSQFICSASIFVPYNFDQFLAVSNLRALLPLRVARYASHVEQLRPQYAIMSPSQLLKNLAACEALPNSRTYEKCARCCGSVFQFALADDRGHLYMFSMRSLSPRCHQYHTLFGLTIIGMRQTEITRLKTSILIANDTRFCYRLTISKSDR